jgi:hypothetical protein
LNYFTHHERAIQGEISPNYFYDLHSIDRIKLHFPSIKIITILRNPYERMMSSYYYLIRSGKFPEDTTFNVIFNENSEYFPQNIYKPTVKKILDLFQRSQIHIDLFDTLEEDSSVFIKRILKFLAVDYKHFTFNENKINQNRVIKSNHLLKLARVVSDKLRGYELFLILEQMKESSAVNKFLYKNKIVKKKTIVFPSKIINRINNDISSIEDILSVNLSHWKK